MSEKLDPNNLGPFENSAIEAENHARTLGRYEAGLLEDMPEYYSERYNRGAVDYLVGMKGLKFYFETIKRFSQPRVLDAGAGMGRAAAEFSPTLGEGLEFWASGLYPGNRDFLPSAIRDRYIVGAYENLDGIEPGSVGGIFSYNGVFFHSEFPELVVQKTDELLAEMGIVKIAHNLQYGLPIPGNYGEQELRCAEDFRKMGYGVSHRLFEGRAEHSYIHNFIMLAIKPGKKGSLEINDMTADNLLMADWFDYDSQVTSFALMKQKFEEQHSRGGVE